MGEAPAHGPHCSAMAGILWRTSAAVRGRSCAWRATHTRAKLWEVARLRRWALIFSILVARRAQENMSHDEATAAMERFIVDHTDMTWWVGKVTPCGPSEDVSRAGDVLIAKVMAARAARATLCAAVRAGVRACAREIWGITPS